MENNSSKSCLNSASKTAAQIVLQRLPHKKAEITARVRALSSQQPFAGWKHPVCRAPGLTDSRGACPPPEPHSEAQILMPLGPGSRSKLCWLHCTPTRSQSTQHTSSMPCVEVTSVPGCRLSQRIVTAAVLPIYLYAIILLHVFLHSLANKKRVARLRLVA